MSVFKTMKVFDCQEGMPKDVRDAFFDFNNDPAVGNDVFVEWTVQEDDANYYSDHEWSVKRRLVDDWLIAHGATPRAPGAYNGETVLIKHWW